MKFRRITATCSTGHVQDGVRSVSPLLELFDRFGCWQDQQFNLARLNAHIKSHIGRNRI